MLSAILAGGVRILCPLGIVAPKAFDTFLIEGVICKYHGFRLARAGLNGLETIREVSGGTLWASRASSQVSAAKTAPNGDLLPGKFDREFRV